MPVIQNGSKVTDFVWDPFDDSRLVVGENFCIELKKKLKNQLDKNKLKKHTYMISQDLIRMRADALRLVPH